MHRLGEKRKLPVSRDHSGDVSLSFDSVSPCLKCASVSDLV